MVLSSLEFDAASCKLSVLDQLELPHNRIMVPVGNSQDAWNVIRKMQVRGAPLIAIVAMLGLAAELTNCTLDNGADSESAAAAQELVLQRLDFLRTSRPTAVNLFNACDAMTTLVAEAVAAEGATGASVRSAVIKAATAMVADDIAANKRQGSFGVQAIRQDCAEKLAAAGAVSVLTHCNTGSLACAGFGTALGVIRALHEEGLLKACYATETRPYNQGARLTAFEMVEDNLPGTLITDSMASFLMAQGGVDAVATGADRVVANGDTANKIGTYQLAIAAKHHGLPFYIVAPVTTLDAALADGSQIKIEQRAAEELTSVAGIKIAADGIRVWNPAFDVTPAELITGIVTDVGVIRPTLNAQGKKVFDIPAFLRAHSSATAIPDTVAASSSCPAPVGYYPLLGGKVVDYICGLARVAEFMGTTHPAEVEQSEIGDGNMNLVFICRGPKGAVIVKQALPYVRCVGEGWPLTMERARFEYMALAEEYKHCPQFTPEVYHFDPTLGALVMRYIEPPHIILRQGLIKGYTYSTLAADVATFLARTLFFTSALHLTAPELRQRVAVWSANREMCALTEQVIFTDPYMIREDRNRWTSPQLDAAVARIRGDTQLKLAVAVLKEKFMTSTQALLHGDLHTGSIMAKDGSTFCIDPEFAFYGPMGFDTGAIIANLLLAYCSQPGHATAAEPRAAYADWILDQMVALHTGFEKEFLALWSDEANRKGDHTPQGHFAAGAELGLAQAQFMGRLFSDTLGFAGAKMIRRIIGIAHVEDMESIKDSEQRAGCERHALAIAHALVKEPGSFASIADVAALARDQPRLAGAIAELQAPLSS
eukprot:TRINITY_DN2240_c0_g1_i2.p1 TRINITY_DN2240_c0_g1~~TRINITY_DN2240_c0_g1_i2.p1  ORF type:complete len:826 (-),score=232.08 TRINITY_DN2240_c0_g1_i2:415-2892(-)